MSGRSSAAREPAWLASARTPHRQAVLARVAARSASSRASRHQVVRAGGGKLVACALGLALLAAALAPGVHAQGGLSDTLTAEERAFLAAHGHLRYVWNAGFPPFTLTDRDGAVQGINRDILRLIAVQLGVEFDTVLAPSFAATLESISNGSADVAGNLASTPERELTMSFTAPYARVTTYLWTREGATLPADRAGSRVGVVQGTAGARVIEDLFPAARIVLVPGLREGLEMLEDGSLDALHGADAAILYLARESGFHGILPAGGPVERRDFSFAVPKDQPLLLSVLEKGLAGVSREERAAIFVKWTGQDLNLPAPQPRQVPLRDAALAGAVVAALAVGIGGPVWIASLRRRVRARTSDLEELAATLELRVVERTRKLETANAELEAFSYAVSHDLRAPLRAMDGFIGVIEQDAQTRLSPASYAAAQRVRAASKRMGTMIDALLALSHVGRAALRVERVDLSLLARERLKELQARDPDRRVETQVEQGLAVEGDPALLGIAVGNLLDNAWKFTSGKPVAHVEVGRELTPQGLAYYVRDDGAGFDPTYADKLFGTFQRLHGAAEFPGHGIGLATVRRVIARHGGLTWAKGEVGRGATFYFTLPPPAAPPPKAALPERLLVTTPKKATP